MTTLPGVPMDADRVRFRATWVQLAWLLGAMTLVMVLSQLVIRTLLGPPTVTSGSPPPAVVIGFFVVLLAGIFRWQGVTVTRESLLVHNVGTRTIAWHDIESIRLRRVLATTTIVVTETSGVRTRLRAPTTGLLSWDRSFGAKYQVIRERYLASHGG